MSQPLAPGSLLQGGKYKIERFISSGGFGCTYEAVHTSLPRRFAIKEFFISDFCARGAGGDVSVVTEGKRALVDKLRGKFIAEAQAICELEHPGIVRVYDVFEENGTAYYVMNYIDGASLSEMTRDGRRLPEVRALKYIRQVCDALALVHSRHRLHLDIKPGNIVVDSDDNAILIDFGVSKQYDEADGENTSTLVGTSPGFAPPEQMSCDVVKFLPATDIYALGATLYKLITGETPPTASRLSSGDELPEIPASMASWRTRTAITEAMRLNKKTRPQSVAEFVKLLDGEGEEELKVISATPAKPADERTVMAPGKPTEERKKSRKKADEVRVIVLIALIAALLVAGGMILGGGGGKRVVKRSNEKGDWEDTEIYEDVPTEEPVPVQQDLEWEDEWEYAPEEEILEEEIPELEEWGEYSAEPVQIAG